MIIRTKSGLANRLRTIFSRLKKSEHLTVAWRPDSKCNGNFLDHFEPVEGVTFVTTTKEQPDYYGNQSDGKPDFSLLRPVPAVVEEVERNLRELPSPFTAIHVRRTDHTRLAKKRKKFTDDDAFQRFVEKYDGPLFVACDSPATQEAYQLRYPDKVRATSQFDFPGKRCKSSLRRAVVDIYTCVEADNFMGSGYSSFSDLILSLREAKHARTRGEIGEQFGTPKKSNDTSLTMLS